MSGVTTETETRTILVVDDDEDFRMQLQVQLEAAGYRVMAAENELAAESLLKQERPDLAIVDLMMDNQDSGFTLCYRIKKHDPTIPVIMVTAVQQETGMAFEVATQDERSWIKADALLEKPILFEQLQREVKRLL